MVNKKRSATLFLSVLAGLPAVVLISSQTAHAQYRVDNGGGHANDASNRLGGGGYNGPTSSSPYAQNGVLTGNVSGLNYFHGNSQTFDPSVFQGRTGNGPSNRLNAIAAPVNYAAPTNGAPNYTPYYNNTQLVAPPPGNYVPAPNGQGQVPAPQVNPLIPTSDTRLQNDLNVNPTDPSLPTPGELNVVGPVDPSGSPSLYSMSPLYGVRAAQGSNPDDNSFLSRQTDNRLSTPADRARTDPASIQRMREELNKTAVPNDQSDQSKTTVAPGGVDLNASNQVPDGAAATNMLSGAKPISSAVDNQAVGTSLSSGQSVQSTLVIAPGKQSRQLADLEKKYAKSSEKLTDVQATDRLNQEMMAQAKSPLDANDPKKAASPVAGTPGGATGIADGSIPAETDKENATPPLKPVLHGPKSEPSEQPYIITSLATGIEAQGLANLLKSGEDQMRQGKFTEAVASYETAEAVAPNNPYVFLGRGFAELGASYYGRAEQDLERAVVSDPAILVGRYDLKGFLGEDRLAFTQKDLQDIADHEKGARPFVLLAFITHNSGDDAATERNLNDAKTRGGYAKLVDLMVSAWNIKHGAK